MKENVSRKVGLEITNTITNIYKNQVRQAVSIKYTTPPEPTKSKITIKKNHLFIHEQPPEQTKSRIKNFTKLNQSSQTKSQ